MWEQDDVFQAAEIDLYQSNVRRAIRAEILQIPVYFTPSPLDFSALDPILGYNSQSWGRSGFDVGRKT